MVEVRSLTGWLKIQCYQRAVALDQYLAVAYFQQGVSNFLIGEFELAFENFNDTLLYLRGNKWINYEQLGLDFKLYSCEVLFNRGLCYIYLKQMEPGMVDLEYAAKEKGIPDHDVIDDAIKEQGQDFTVFSIPVRKVFRPSEAKVKNIQSRDWLGKSRLVATAGEDGGHRRKVSHEIWARDDRPLDQVSYAATTLVKPNVTFRTRQQSEPPLRRNVFPPTPPPENEKPSFRAPRQSPPRRKSPEPTAESKRARSSSRPRPPNLDLGFAAFEKKASPVEEPRRRAPPRSASERPAERRHDRREAAGARTVEYEPSHKDGLFGTVDEDYDAATRPDLRSSSRARSSSRNNGAPRHSGPALQGAPIIEEEEEEEVDVTSPDAISSSRSQTWSQNLPLPSPVPTQVRSILFKVELGKEFVRIPDRPEELDFHYLMEKVRKKLRLSAIPKVRMKDEVGDMITIADQEDLETCISIGKEIALKDRSKSKALLKEGMLKLDVRKIVETRIQYPQCC